MWVGGTNADEEGNWRKLFFLIPETDWSSKIYVTLRHKWNYLNHQVGKYYMYKLFDERSYLCRCLIKGCHVDDCISISIGITAVCKLPKTLPNISVS